MYAIVEIGGRQWKVEPGARLDINRVSTVVGGELPVERVLLAHDGTHAVVGRPYVEGAKVIFEVLEHRQGPKTISYHFRRRENWRKTVGNRAQLTRVVVKEILCTGGAAPQDTATAAKKAAPVKTTRRPAAKKNKP